MKVAILATYAASEDASYRAFAADLASALRSAGHDVATYAFPFEASCGVRQYAALRLIDVPTADRAIALSAPSAAIRHPEKTLWLFDRRGIERRLFETGVREAAARFAADEAGAASLAARGIPATVLRQPSEQRAWRDALEQLLA